MSVKCPECGKRSNLDIDDSGICKKCDALWSEQQKQHKLTEYFDFEESKKGVVKNED